MGMREDEATADSHKRHSGSTLLTGNTIINANRICPNVKRSTDIKEQVNQKEDFKYSHVTINNVYVYITSTISGISHLVLINNCTWFIIHLITPMPGMFKRPAVIVQLTLAKETNNLSLWRNSLQCQDTISVHGLHEVNLHTYLWLKYFCTRGECIPTNSRWQKKINCVNFPGYIPAQRAEIWFYHDKFM